MSLFQFSVLFLLTVIALGVWCDRIMGVFYDAHWRRLRKNESPYLDQMTRGSKHASSMICHNPPTGWGAPQTLFSTKEMMADRGSEDMIGLSGDPAFDKPTFQIRRMKDLP